jgi:NAD(P)H-dependent flavin oxidoreductase YrpB (nitropropane dioxygenase family)
MGRPVLRTPLCDLLGIEYPIILAGMGAGNEGGAAGPELVAAVSEAGGLGVLGGTGHDLDDFHQAIAEIRRLTKKPFGVDLLLPNVGGRPEAAASSTNMFSDSARVELDRRYWDFVDNTIKDLGLTEPSSPEPPRGGPFTETPYAAAERQQRHIQAIIDERPAVFAAGLGSPKPYVPALHEAGITVFGLVGNVKTARRVQADGVDVVVAQGYEAGGHTGRVGTFALVPQVVDAVSPTPVVLAGGVGDGRAVAAALALGAQAVWVGTAFLATPEANILPEHRQHLLDASEEDTRVTRLYSGKTARALNNPMVEAWEKSGLAALPMGQQGRVSGRLMAAVRASGRNDLTMQLGGQIAGALREVRPAHVVLDEMVREAVDVLSALSRTSVTFALA